MSIEFAVAVTLGRNIGRTPMSDDAWAAFKRQVGAELAHAGTLLQTPAAEADAVGEWQGEYEGAAAFIALIPGEAIPAVKRRLIEAGRKYNQDAVGFIAAAASDSLLTCR